MKRVFYTFLLLFVCLGSRAQLTYEQSAAIICRQSPQLEVKMPNIFTPNADYKNDNFTSIVQSEICIDTYYLTVYNQWGQLLHESRVYSQGWNGMDYQGNPFPEGTYYYILTYKAIQLDKAPLPKEVKQRGFFELAR